MRIVQPEDIAVEGNRNFLCLTERYVCEGLDERTGEARRKPYRVRRQDIVRDRNNDSFRAQRAARSLNHHIRARPIDPPHRGRERKRNTFTVSRQ